MDSAIEDENRIEAGIATEDPMAGIEAQDAAPAERERREDLSGVELTRLFREEASDQGARVRGPIYLDELVDEDSDIRPAVYYKRLNREDRRALQEKSREQVAAGFATAEDLNSMVFIERALDKTGRRLFASMQTDEARESHWNDEMIARVVREMDRGSRTRLTDEDLGKS